MKILYMITDLDFGGAETQLMRMVHYVKEYTQDDVAVKKTIFDSEVGELKTSNTTSKDYNDAGDMSYTETPDGNVLSVVADRGTIKKGNIRQDERINYML